MVFESWLDGVVFFEQKAAKFAKDGVGWFFKQEVRRREESDRGGFYCRDAEDAE